MALNKSTEIQMIIKKHYIRREVFVKYVPEITEFVCSTESICLKAQSSLLKIDPVYLTEAELVPNQDLSILNNGGKKEKLYNLQVLISSTGGNPFLHIVNSLGCNLKLYYLH